MLNQSDHMEPTTIRRIGQLDLDALQPLLIASRAEGFLLVQRLADEYQDGSNRFQLDGEALFGAYQGELLGVCGLNRDPFDGTYGRLRHLYVLPSSRQLGVGRQLVHAALHAATPFYQVVRLRTLNPMAARFYLNLGFTPTADEQATHMIQLPPIFEP